MTKTANDYASEIMRMIEHDMTVGFSWGSKLPRNVGSFSALHDHCDANMYLLEALNEVDTFIAEDETDEHYALVNAIMSEVDRRLRLFAWGHDDCSGVFAFHERLPHATVYACPVCQQHRVAQDDPKAHADAMSALAESIVEAADL